MNDEQFFYEYPYYNGERDPRLGEPDNADDVELFEHVECSNGCGFWAVNS